ncbi:Ankyrin repeat protein 1 [Giardia muris]|uniref:Ankyrin repeat protein 1 n=1 Tax=Giardia muris TaxID=5742 RepID=A0A4Z1SPB7_GIAMU|nr:Ankyrin repeat protein 1 [Giardia muris]|eukprot:TNJ27662.1 Ankyrin repeat protein 1 [Giardia muris]
MSEAWFSAIRHHNNDFVLQHIRTCAGLREADASGVVVAALARNTEALQLLMDYAGPEDLLEAAVACMRIDDVEAFGMVRPHLAQAKEESEQLLTLAINYSAHGIIKYLLEREDYTPSFLSAQFTDSSRLGSFRTNQILGEFLPADTTSSSGPKLYPGRETSDEGAPLFFSPQTQSPDSIPQPRSSPSPSTKTTAERRLWFAAQVEELRQHEEAQREQLHFLGLSTHNRDAIIIYLQEKLNELAGSDDCAILDPTSLADFVRKSNFVSAGQAPYAGMAYGVETTVAEPGSELQMLIVQTVLDTLKAHPELVAAEKLITEPELEGIRAQIRLDTGLNLSPDALKRGSVEELGRAIEKLQGYLITQKAQLNKYQTIIRNLMDDRQKEVEDFATQVKTLQEEVRTLKEEHQAVKNPSPICGRPSTSQEEQLRAEMEILRGICDNLQEELDATRRLKDDHIEEEQQTDMNPIEKVPETVSVACSAMDVVETNEISIQSTQDELKVILQDQEMVTEQPSPGLDQGVETDDTNLEVPLMQDEAITVMLLPEPPEPPVSPTITLSELDKERLQLLAAEVAEQTGLSLESESLWHQVLKRVLTQPNFHHARLAIHRMPWLHKQILQQVEGWLVSLHELVQAGDISSLYIVAPLLANRRDRNNRTALMLAAELNDPAAARVLAAFEAGAQTSKGHTALMIAAQLGHEDVARVLADTEAKVLDRKGRGALYYAREAIVHTNPEVSLRIAHHIQAALGFGLGPRV